MGLVPSLSVADVVHGNVIVLAPKEWNCAKCLEMAQHVLRGYLSLPLGKSRETRAVTYHDPCYLGRYNGEIAAPRALLGKIGIEVAEKLIKYSDNGSTVGAVNFVEAALPVKAGETRFLHIHANVPGVMRRINEVFSARSLNISAQYLQTDPEVGYVVVDVVGDLDEADIITDLQAIEGTIKTRFLY